MKIALIHGIGHQGSTWHYADLICQELDRTNPESRFSKHLLPDDGGHGEKERLESERPESLGRKWMALRKTAILTCFFCRIMV